MSEDQYHPSEEEDVNGKDDMPALSDGGDEVKKNVIKSRESDAGELLLLLQSLETPMLKLDCGSELPVLAAYQIYGLTKQNRPTVDQIINQFHVLYTHFSKFLTTISFTNPGLQLLNACHEMEIYIILNPQDPITSLFQAFLAKYSELSFPLDRYEEIHNTILELKRLEDAQNNANETAKGIIAKLDTLRPIGCILQPITLMNRFIYLAGPKAGEILSINFPHLKKDAIESFVNAKLSIEPPNESLANSIHEIALDLEKDGINILQPGTFSLSSIIIPDISNEINILKPEIGEGDKIKLMSTSSIFELHRKILAENNPEKQPLIETLQKLWKLYLIFEALENEEHTTLSYAVHITYFRSFAKKVTGQDFLASRSLILPIDHLTLASIAKSLFQPQSIDHSQFEAFILNPSINNIPPLEITCSTKESSPQSNFLIEILNSASVDIPKPTLSILSERYCRLLEVLVSEKMVICPEDFTKPVSEEVFSLRFKRHHAQIKFASMKNLYEVFPQQEYRKLFSGGMSLSSVTSFLIYFKIPEDNATSKLLLHFSYFLDLHDSLAKLLNINSSFIKMFNIQQICLLLSQQILRLNLSSVFNIPKPLYTNSIHLNRIAANFTLIPDFDCSKILHSLDQMEENLSDDNSLNLDPLFTRVKLCLGVEEAPKKIFQAFESFQEDPNPNTFKRFQDKYLAKDSRFQVINSMRTIVESILLLPNIKLAKSVINGSCAKGLTFITLKDEIPIPAEVHSIPRPKFHISTVHFNKESQNILNDLFVELQDERERIANDLVELEELRAEQEKYNAERKRIMEERAEFINQFKKIKTEAPSYDTSSDSEDSSEFIIRKDDLGKKRSQILQKYNSVINAELLHRLQVHESITHMSSTLHMSYENDFQLVSSQIQMEAPIQHKSKSAISNATKKKERMCFSGEKVTLPDDVHQLIGQKPIDKREYEDLAQQINQFRSKVFEINPDQSLEQLYSSVTQLRQSKNLIRERLINMFE